MTIMEVTKRLITGDDAATAAKATPRCAHQVMSPWSYERLNVQRIDRSYSSAGDYCAVLTDETVVAVRHCVECGWVQRGASS